VPAGLLDHDICQIIDARRDDLVQPAQEIRALFLCGPGENQRTRVWQQRWRVAYPLRPPRLRADHFAISRVDDVHGLAGRAIQPMLVDVMLGDCSQCASSGVRISE
jgi:hypothetical protein